LWSSASFKIIKIGILLSLVRRFEMNKTHHRVHFRISAPLAELELLFCRMKSIDFWVIRIERHGFNAVTILPIVAL